MKTRRELLSSAASITLLSGCVGGDGGLENESQTTTSSSNSTKNVTRPDPNIDEASLLLNWKPNGLHVPYYTARAEGFYEERGLPVSEIKPGEGSDFSAKQTGLENVAFGITSSDQVLNINSRGVSTVAVGVVMQKSPVVVFTTEETFGGPLETVDQLKEKTVGTGPGMVEILTRLLLERNGVLDSVEMVSTGYDTIQKLLNGSIDAAGGVFGDAIAAEHQGRTVYSIPVANSIPSYGHVIATAPSFADEHPDAVRAFLQATAKGAAYAMNDPESGVDHLIEANPVLEETRAQALDNWTRMAQGFMLSEAVSERGWGWSRATPWETTFNALRDADLLGGSLDPKSVWTNEYLTTEYPYIGAFDEQIDGA